MGEAKGVVFYLSDAPVITEFVPHVAKTTDDPPPLAFRLVEGDARHAYVSEATVRPLGPSDPLPPLLQLHEPAAKWTRPRSTRNGNNAKARPDGMVSTMRRQPGGRHV